MTVLISKARRDEVISAARDKHADSTATLINMHTAHGKRVAKRLKRKWTSKDDKKVREVVTRQLAL
jgi:threonine synthase